MFFLKIIIHETSMLKVLLPKGMANTNSMPACRNTVTSVCRHV